MEIHSLDDSDGRNPVDERAGLGTMSSPSDDPLMWVRRFLTKVNSIWLRQAYPFAGFGRGVSIHHSCEIRRCYSHRIRLGDAVTLNRDVWLNVPVVSHTALPAIIIGDHTNIGRRTIISATNQIRIDERVLVAPSVFITDHNHEYADPDRSIYEQGTTVGGRVVVERNCWLGYGSMIVAGKSEVVIGRNSVVGAYSVVTQSCPSHSVLAGNPARVVKDFDPTTGEWRRT
jgi:acetyltransferase-like isoleucine patch superfamily enzyme